MASESERAGATRSEARGAHGAARFRPTTWGALPRGVRSWRHAEEHLSSSLGQEHGDAKCIKYTWGTGQLLVPRDSSRPGSSMRCTYM